jgi:hypothetical protein
MGPQNASGCECYARRRTRVSYRLDAVEYGSDLLQGQNRRLVPKDVHALGCGDGEESRDRGGGNERGAVGELVIHDDMRAGAKTTR